MTLRTRSQGSEDWTNKKSRRREQLSCCWLEAALLPANEVCLSLSLPKNCSLAAVSVIINGRRVLFSLFSPPENTCSRRAQVLEAGTGRREKRAAAGFLLLVPAVVVRLSSISSSVSRLQQPLNLTLSLSDHRLFFSIFFPFSRRRHQHSPLSVSACARP